MHHRRDNRHHPQPSHRNLRYLQKGGRISALSAKIGSVLGIKPILWGNELGQIICINKVRGERKAYDALADAYDRLCADRTARIGGRSHAPSRGVAPLPISTHWQEQWERASRLMLDIASTVDIRYSLLRPESWRKAWRKAISNRNGLAASGRTPDLMLDLHATLIDLDGMMRERDPRVTVVSCTECGQRIAAPFGMRAGDCPSCGVRLDLEALVTEHERDARSRTVDGSPAELASWLSNVIGRRVSRKQVEWLLRSGRLHGCERLGSGRWRVVAGELLDAASHVG